MFEKARKINMAGVARFLSKLVLLGAALLAAACSAPESRHIEPGLKLKPGLWKTVQTARIPPGHPYLRSMPTPSDICVGPDGRGAAPYVEENGDEGERLRIYGWLRGDLETRFAVVGRIGEDGMVSDVVGRWAGPCPPEAQDGVTETTVFR